MTININPSRVNIPSSSPGKASVGARKQPQTQASPVPVPQRAQVGVIPEPESLATLIRSAVAALRQGTLWDRGTILNILA